MKRNNNALDKVQAKNLLYLCVINLIEDVMKIRNYMLIGLLPLCFSACQTDEIPVPPEGNGNTEQTPEEPGESEDDSDKTINE